LASCFALIPLLGILEGEFDEDPSFPAGVWDHQTKSRALDGSRERVAIGLDLLKNSKVSGEKVAVKVQA